MAIGMRAANGEKLGCLVVLRKPRYGKRPKLKDRLREVKPHVRRPRKVQARLIQPPICKHIFWNRFGIWK